MLNSQQWEYLCNVKIVNLIWLGAAAGELLFNNYFLTFRLSKKNIFKICQLVGWCCCCLVFSPFFENVFLYGKKCKDCVSIQFGELSEVQALSWEGM